MSIQKIIFLNIKCIILGAKCAMSYLCTFIILLLSGYVNDLDASGQILAQAVILYDDL
jgi:hypothetical protein